MQKTVIYEKWQNGKWERESNNITENFHLSSALSVHWELIMIWTSIRMRREVKKTHKVNRLSKHTWNHKVCRKDRNYVETGEKMHDNRISGRAWAGACLSGGLEIVNSLQEIRGSNVESFLKHCGVCGGIVEAVRCWFSSPPLHASLMFWGDLLSFWSVGGGSSAEGCWDWRGWRAYWK